VGYWWVSDLINDPTLGFPALFAWAFCVIGSIVLHELAHGWAAIRLGDQTPIHTGHMTWNPLVHMGGFSLIAFLLIGIAWGSMPVDTSRLRGRHGAALVALAGPAMNVALAIACCVGFGLWAVLAPKMGVTDPLLTNFERFFFFGVSLNIVLALFNLVPIMPLDGGRILAEYSRAYADLLRTDNGRWIFFGAFALLFFFGAELIFGFGFGVGSLGVRLAEAAVNGLVP
jgi:Zn-dependent protease